MKDPLSIGWMADQQDQRIAQAVEREQGRLRNFIRRRVPDARDAEDILQDVFYELIEAYRTLQPIDQVGAWMFRVARNRIIDRFRKRRPEASLSEPGNRAEDGEDLSLEELLPSADAGPEAAYARSVLIEQLEDALEELPKEQRAVFMAHEIEGRSFKEIADESGVSLNTLLSRKRYAVQHLRRRLQGIYVEFSRRLK
jgi:RNA polymerase sigma factor (sigma-70 family)